MTEYGRSGFIMKNKFMCLNLKHSRASYCITNKCVLFVIVVLFAVVFSFLT